MQRSQTHLIFKHQKWTHEMRFWMYGTSNYHRRQSDKTTGESCFNREMSPKAVWYQLVHTQCLSKWISDPTGKSLTMAGKLQLLNLLLLVIMHTKGAFKKEEEEFFSHPGVKQKESSLRTALQGVFGFSCQILSDVMWSEWRRRRRCHCMPSDRGAILIKYPLFSLSLLLCCFLPLPLLNRISDSPDHLPSILLSVFDQCDEDLSLYPFLPPYLGVLLSRYWYLHYDKLVCGVRWFSLLLLDDCFKSLNTVYHRQNKKMIR